MSPPIECKPGAIRGLGQILASKAACRILLVTGGRSFRSSGAQAETEPIFSDYETLSLSGFSSNPKLEEISERLPQVRKFQPEVVVGIGGGSVLDIAKLLAFFSPQDFLPEEYFANLSQDVASALPTIAVPTTAGSGSEATQFAVVYVEGKKHSVAHPSILPCVSILDPELLKSLPTAVAASSGLDVLCQAVESCWSVGSTNESTSRAEEALRITHQNLVQSVLRPDSENRRQMLLASHGAGQAINTTKTTLPHALSYTMTSHFGVAHGNAAALTLAATLSFNSEVSEADCNDARGAGHVRQQIDSIVRCFDCTTVEEACIAIQDKIRSTGLPHRLRDVGIEGKKDIESLCNGVNAERLKNNPRKVTRKDLLRILQASC